MSMQTKADPAVAYDEKTQASNFLLNQAGYGDELIRINLGRPRFS